MNRIDDPFMEAICEELSHIEGFQYACSVTNDWPMSLARKEAKKINKDWLKCHFLEVADLSIDFSEYV